MSPLFQKIYNCLPCFRKCTTVSCFRIYAIVSLVSENIQLSPLFQKIYNCIPCSRKCRTVSCFRKCTTVSCFRKYTIVSLVSENVELSLVSENVQLSLVSENIQLSPLFQKIYNCLPLKFHVNQACTPIKSEVIKQHNGKNKLKYNVTKHGIQENHLTMQLSPLFQKIYNCLPCFRKCRTSLVSENVQLSLVSENIQLSALFQKIYNCLPLKFHVNQACTPIKSEVIKQHNGKNKLKYNVTKHGIQENHLNNLLGSDRIYVQS